MNGLGKSDGFKGDKREVQLDNWTRPVFLAQLSDPRSSGDSYSRAVQTMVRSANETRTGLQFKKGITGRLQTRIMAAILVHFRRNEKKGGVRILAVWLAGLGGDLVMARPWA